LVIVEGSGPYLVHRNPYSENGPDLDNRVLYAADRGAENFNLIRRYPNRTAYLEQSDALPDDSPVVAHIAVPTVTVRPLQTLSGPAITFRVQVRPAGRTAVAYLQIGSNREIRTLTTDATPNTVYETEWTVGVSPPAGGGSFVPLPGPAGSVQVGMGYGRNARRAFKPRHYAEEFHYRIDGPRVEMLVPSGKLILERAGKKFQGRYTDTIAGLQVTASPATQREPT
jgi:hypothetical protein